MCQVVLGAVFLSLTPPTAPRIGNTTITILGYGFDVSLSSTVPVRLQSTTSEYREWVVATIVNNTALEFAMPEWVLHNEAAQQGVYSFSVSRVR